MRFRCPECGSEFQVSFIRLLFVKRFRGKDPVPTRTAFYLKCPKCCRKLWLTPID